METEHAFISILIILGVALVTVSIFRRLRLPPIVAYLVAGVAIGPQVLDWVEANDTVRLLGEIGVAFLLFTIGLEFSWSKLKAMRSVLLSLGGGQVAIGTLSGALIAWSWGVGWAAALVVGGALAMSSTAIVLKQLADQREVQSRHGRLAVGVLLFQDLAAVPFIVAIPILAAGGGNLAVPLGLALLKGALALTIALAAGRWLLRPLFQEVAESGFPELFTITVLLVSLAAAFGTAMLGLSLALGAFLAGMMLGETEFRHQIDNDIRPIRDLLVGLFFVRVGMDLDLLNISRAWELVALLVIGLCVGKGGVIYLLARLTGSVHTTAMRLGVILGHGGEFSVALLTLALSSGLLDPSYGQAIIAAVIVTMVIAPIAIRRSNLLVQRRDARPDAAQPELHEVPAHPVLLCGFGRTGGQIASVLERIDVPYVALDRNPARVKQGWDSGVSVYFGDAANPAVLQAAGLETARAVVLTFADCDAQMVVLKATHRARPELPVLVRARDDGELRQLVSAGAIEGVPETLEAALMLVFQLLVLLEVPAGEALEHIRIVRGDRYPLLRGFTGAGSPMSAAGALTDSEHLKTVVLSPGSSAVGRRLAELNLAARGVLIARLRRPSVGILPPDLELTLQSGDVLVLHGQSDNLRAVAGDLAWHPPAG